MSTIPVSTRRRSSDWVGKIVTTGGEIVVRHGSLYSGSTADDSLSARSVTVTVQTCTPNSGGGGGGGGGAPTCTSATHSWSGYQGVNVNTPSYSTGVTIPAALAGETKTVTAVVVETYDAQTGGTVPSRATQNQTGEKIGIRIGTVDATSVSNDVPDTVAQGAVDDNYSGIHASTLSDWVGKVVTAGGEIVVRHGSLYSGTTGDNSLSARSVTVTVQTCTPTSGGGGGGGGGTVTGYVWSPQSRLTQVSVNGDVNEQMWYLAGGERLLHVDATGTHLNLGGMLERHITPAGVKTLKRSYMIAGTLVAVRTIAAGVDDIHYLFGDVRGSTTMTIKRGTTSITEQQWYTAHGTTRGVNTITSTNRGYIGQETDTSGLNYLHNRYHDPTLGIFITVDPLVAKTGEPYLYAGGNPTSLSDPTGLCAVNSYRGYWYDDGAACSGQTGSALVGSGTHDQPYRVSGRGPLDATAAEPWFRSCLTLSVEPCVSKNSNGTAAAEIAELLLRSGKVGVASGGQLVPTALNSAIDVFRLPVGAEQYGCDGDGNDPLRRAQFVVSSGSRSGVDDRPDRWRRDMYFRCRLCYRWRSGWLEHCAFSVRHISGMR